MSMERGIAQACLSLRHIDSGIQLAPYCARRFNESRFFASAIEWVVVMWLLDHRIVRKPARRVFRRAILKAAQDAVAHGAAPVATNQAATNVREEGTAMSKNDRMHERRVYWHPPPGETGASSIASLRRRRVR
jgi:hypothetical protein